MAVKTYYLDKRTLKNPTSDGSLINLKNLLDLKDYIETVIEGYSKSEVLTINSTTHSSTAQIGVVSTEVITDGHGGTNTVVVADGTQGQIKTISLKTKTNGSDSVVLSLTTSIGSFGTLATVGDVITMIYTPSGWLSIGTYID